jgi:hypothetical protein
MSHLATFSKNVTLNLIFHCKCRKIVHECNNFAGTFGVTEGKCKTSLDWPPDAAMGMIRVGKEDTETNLADLLTKVLSQPRRERLIARIMYIGSGTQGEGEGNQQGTSALANDQN